jgi:hypothetical protein
LNQNSLSCTQRTIEKDEIASSALGTNALTELMHIGACSNLHWLRIVDVIKEEGPQLPGALLYLRYLLLVVVLE